MFPFKIAQWHSFQPKITVLLKCITPDSPTSVLKITGHLIILAGSITSVFMCTYPVNGVQLFPKRYYPENDCIIVLLTLKLLGPGSWSEWISDSHCSLKPLWSGMGEVEPARTSPTLHPHPSHCAVIILFKSVPVHQLP